MGDAVRDVEFREEERAPTKKEIRDGEFVAGDRVTCSKVDMEGKSSRPFVTH